MAHKTILSTCIAIAVFVLFIFAPNASAQESACPPGSYGSSLAGSFKPDLELCRVSLLYGGASLQYQVINYDIFGHYVCEEQAQLRYIQFLNAAAEFGLTANDYSFYFAWPDDKISNEARIRLYFWMPELNGLVAPPPPLDGRWIIRYYWATGIPVSGTGGMLHELTQYSLRVESFPLGVRYTTLYYLDVTIPTVFVPEGTAHGGFFQFALQKTTGEPFTYDITLSSPQIDIADASYPLMCPIDDGYMISTATATPTPSLTPTGVWNTPTSTPTPGATSPYYTPRPTTTLTPFAWSTIPPQPAPTRLPLPTLISIVWPTIGIPTLPTFAAITATPTIPPTPSATPPPTIDYSATTDFQIEHLATVWAAPLAAANGVMISGTEQISSTQEVVAGTMSYVVIPVRLAKAVYLYAPTVSPLFATLMGLIIIRYGVIILRMVISLVTTFLELIRRIWESVPLN